MISRSSVRVPLLLCFLFSLLGAAPAWAGWEELPAVLGRIKPPVFPDRTFLITEHGAVPGGEADATAAIHRAITACHEAGGGRVVVPAGLWKTGAVRLRSRVNLHLEAGAVLAFSANPADYPTVLTRWEGVECLNYSPLIYAYEEKNIAITGSGVLDGGASYENWWSWKNYPQGRPYLQTPDRDRLFEYNRAGTPVAERVFGAGHFLRPSFIQPYRCRNILIEGVTIRNAPFWQIHPVLSTNITVRGVTALASGPNTDGCDPESCRDVLIEDCHFETGDDCIAIKSGRDEDGRRLAEPSENIVIRRCRMTGGHGGVVLGSEISGDCRNVFVEDCVMDSPRLVRALRFKSNAGRGGTIENIFLRRIEVGRVGGALIQLQLNYDQETGPHTPVVRNVVVEEIKTAASLRVLHIQAAPAARIEGLVFRDCDFRGVEQADVLAERADVMFANVRVRPAAPLNR